MWRKFSLRARINSLVVLVLAAALVVDVVRLALEAGSRVEAEDRSVIQLTRQLLESIGPSLAGAPDAIVRLDEMVADLNRLRHLSIVREGAGGTASAANDARTRRDAAESPPSWFVSLIHPDRFSVPITLQVGGELQTLTVTSHPNDEMREIWDGIVVQLALSVIVALVLTAVTSLVVRRALAPLDSLSRAMLSIEAGEYRTRVEPAGAPEFTLLCVQLNHLAATLNAALADRRRIAEQMVSLQDLERKDIARELHDEFGPYLFALRAHAGAVMRWVETAKAPAVSRHAAAMLEQINALQQFNRRILERLRPIGLADLGLPAAIDALLRLWRQSHPAVAVESRICPEIGRFSDVVELTAYRVVQEALTNVIRHAEATKVVVSIAPCHAPEREHPSISVRVCDNGRGLDPKYNVGFGLVGMLERVSALGGTLTIESNGGGGVTLEAVIPTFESSSGICPDDRRKIIPERFSLIRIAP